MTNQRCHWWCGSYWAAADVRPHDRPGTLHTCRQLDPGEPCPYCGEALPEGGPEEDNQ